MYITLSCVLWFFLKSCNDNCFFHIVTGPEADVRVASDCSVPFYLTVYFAYFGVSLFHRHCGYIFSGNVTTYLI